MEEGYVLDAWAFRRYGNIVQENARMTNTRCNGVTIKNGR